MPKLGDCMNTFSDCDWSINAPPATTTHTVYSSRHSFVTALVLPTNSRKVFVQHPKTHAAKLHFEAKVQALLEGCCARSAAMSMRTFCLISQVVLYRSFTSCGTSSACTEPLAAISSFFIAGLRKTQNVLSVALSILSEQQSRTATMTTKTGQQLPKHDENQTTMEEMSNAKKKTATKLRGFGCHHLPSLSRSSRRYLLTTANSPESTRRV